LTDRAHAPASAPDQSDTVETRPNIVPVGYGRLSAWLVLVAVMAALAFATEALVSDQATQPSSGFGQPATRYDDTFYRYSFAISGIVTFAVLLGIVLLIARGLPRKETFALYRPKSWPRTVGLVLGVLAATYVLIILVSSALGPGAETDQGIPVFWDGSRAAQLR
jgi:hypothetical protein